MEETELSDGWMDGRMEMDPPPDGGVQLQFKDCSEAPSLIIDILLNLDILYLIFVQS